MFGAPVAYFFEYLLGIKQAEGSGGYRSMIIAPQAVSKFEKMSGSMEIPTGTVAVSYENHSGHVDFKITIPPNTKAVFRYKNLEYCLEEGENSIFI